MHRSRKRGGTVYPLDMISSGISSKVVYTGDAGIMVPSSGLACQHRSKAFRAPLQVPQPLSEVVDASVSRAISGNLLVLYRSSYTGNHACNMILAPNMTIPPQILFFSGYAISRKPDNHMSSIQTVCAE